MSEKLAAQTTAWTRQGRESPDIPRSAEAVTAAWLEAALRSSGAIERARVTGLDKELSPAGSGGGYLTDLLRLRPVYDLQEPGAPDSLVLKLPRAEPHPFAVAGYAREVRFYSQLAATAPVATPACYFARFDPNDGSFGLLLEDLSGLRAGDDLAGCSRAEAEAAMVGAARLHAFWWGEKWPAAVATLSGGRPSPAPPPVTEAMVEKVLSEIGPDLAPSASALARRMPVFKPAVEAVLARSPQTLLHQDFRLDNMFFRPSSLGDSRLELVLIDWQLLRPGAGVYDLAWFMTAGMQMEHFSLWSDDLLRLYDAWLNARGVDAYDFDSCLRDFRLALIANFGRWIGVFFNLRRSSERAEAVLRAALLRAAQATTGFDAMSIAEAAAAN